MELNCRKLIGSKNDGNTFSFDELIKNIKAGILLTVGNLSSVVLTSMDRWFVKALMTTLAFAQYSFAVSMENFMNVAVTPVTTTLYNYFCKATDEVKVRKARNYVMIFAALIVSCAFPARFILEVYLTKYIDSAKVIFSVSIEMLQLLLRLGTFQVSDIVYNTLGGMLGGLCYIVGKKVHERLSK